MLRYRPKESEAFSGGYRRYEISEIRYEQGDRTPFYVVEWRFLQPLRPRVPEVTLDHTDSLEPMPERTMSVPGRSHGR